MPAGVYTMYVEQGASYELHVTVQGISNLTDYVARGQIRKSATNNEIITPLNCSVGASGITISLSAATTSKLETKGKCYSEITQYYYDIELENRSNGSVIRLLNGIVNVSPEVTK